VSPFATRLALPFLIISIASIPRSVRQAVGTDPRMAQNAGRKLNAGIYRGALLPPPGLGRFEETAAASDILGGSVVGSLLDEAFSPPINFAQSGVWRAIRKDLSALLPRGQSEAMMSLSPGNLSHLRDMIKAQLNDMYKPPGSDEPGAAYEARVLHGIWATAPYLHNGSVASLWELMLPASERKTSFMVGSREFDPKNVGRRTDTSPFSTGTFTVDATTGNGNGGHEYGTNLTSEERWQIVEYLKQL